MALINIIMAIIMFIKLKFNDFEDFLNNLIVIIAFIFNNLKQH